MRRSSMALPIASLLAMSIAGVEAQEPPAETASRSVPFELPCERYLQGLRGEGNFGVLITGKDSAFAGSHHLAEDVWLPAGTEVRSVADGIVRYSDFSPTWTDERGQVHWNLGNVIVIEHPLAAESDLDRVCSLSAHLAADRCVETGDRVQRGQVIGHIGKDRSEENGRYPAHLHFGLHRGAYLQIPPAWRRELEETARTTGLVVGPEAPVRGEIEIRLLDETSVLVQARDDHAASVVLSLLMGSTAPGRKPADIAVWCSGYGDRLAVDEWLRPSRWIASRLAPHAPPGSR